LVAAELRQRVRVQRVVGVSRSSNFIKAISSEYGRVQPLFEAILFTVACVKARACVHACVCEVAVRTPTKLRYTALLRVFVCVCVCLCV
jgi:branched-subunit amino acid permease